LKKIFYLILVIVLLSVSVLSGCRLFTQSSTASVPSSGTLNLTGVDPLTLDPATANEAGSNSYIIQIFSGLLKMDSNLEPAPDIAAAMPAISPDNLTYTFKLRQDVKFQDGRPVKADDFKFSWERVANPATNSPTAATYLGDIVGVKDELSGQANQISGVKVVDDYTLQVTIVAPESHFLYKLTFPTAFVVDQNNVHSGAGWWRKPNGTGPFKLNQWVQNTSLTLTKNDSFYGEKAKISQIKFTYNANYSDMDLYELGQIDITGGSILYYDKIMDKSEPFYNDLAVSPELSIEYIGFNCNQPPFDDANIRRAFSMAIDKDKIINLIYRDMVQKAGGILPPGMPGYSQNLVSLNYDVNQANALIASSKYGSIDKLPPIVLTSSGEGGGAGPLLQTLVFQWKQNLGVDVKIRQIDPNLTATNFKAEVDQMYYFNWIADYPHPQDFLDVLFRSSSDYNYGSYTSAEVDTMIQQAGQASDQAQSFSLYQRAEQKIVDDAACLPISFGKSYTLVKPYVKGFSVNALGFADFSNVYLTSH
jgi:oligopeptide transport system substrate-binding protein